MKKIIIVAGARPNFVKIAPLMNEFKKHKDFFSVLLIHTGQHYDFKMSEIFFKNLNIPKPDIYLNIGSGSHAVQTAKIMIALEKILLKKKPDLVVVVGDVNSTLACSLTASKLNIKIAHVEAGLRSFDRTMPEEINRIVTDSLSDYLFVSEKSGLKNLKNEGIDKKKIYFVGNIMIDSLLHNMKAVYLSNILNNLKLKKKSYCLMTLHRPSNVDGQLALYEIYDILKAINKKILIVYSVHPRTRKMLIRHKLLNKFKKLPNLIMIAPLGYVDFIRLLKEAMFMLTDSGGIQEEATVLKVTCLTLRENTERPVTLTEGTNYLVGRDKNKILRYVDQILKGGAKKGKTPVLWNGKTANKIVEIIKRKGVML